MTHESGVWIPNTEEEKQTVLRQMNRILETSHFRNSRRYPALFRFIVEESLAGRGEFLKERLLGVQVFGRPADYDTAADPIVRVTVAEIRKRIAQYYHEEAHEPELRIELLPGSYEPEFRKRRDSSSTIQAATLEASTHDPPVVIGPHEAILEPESPLTPLRPIRRAQPFLWLPLACAALAVAGYFGWRWLHPSALEELWEPVLASHRTITFCLPTGAARDNGATAMAAGVVPADPSHPPTPTPDSRSPTFRDFETLSENVVFSDALATLRISNWMASRHYDSRYRLTSATTLDDLREGPNVLIGGLDNLWTLRAIAPLRFHFSGLDKNQFWILDTQNPAKRDWALNVETSYGAVTNDYAIIARIHDAATGQIEFVVAGIGMSGTAAAGEFLIDPAQAELLRQKIGPSFRDHDFEAVISTDVVDGVAGAPRILVASVR